MTVAFKVHLILLIAASLVVQPALIFPYTAFARTEINQTTAPSEEVQLSMLSVNLPMENTNYDGLGTIISCCYRPAPTNCGLQSAALDEEISACVKRHTD